MVAAPPGEHKWNELVLNRHKRFVPTESLCKISFENSRYLTVYHGKPAVHFISKEWTCFQASDSSGSGGVLYSFAIRQNKGYRFLISKGSKLLLSSVLSNFYWTPSGANNKVTTQNAQFLHVFDQRLQKDVLKLYSKQCCYVGYSVRYARLQLCDCNSAPTSSKNHIEIKIR